MKKAKNRDRPFEAKGKAAKAIWGLICDASEEDPVAWKDLWRQAKKEGLTYPTLKKHFKEFYRMGLIRISVNPEDPTQTIIEVPLNVTRSKYYDDLADLMRSKATALQELDPDLPLVFDVPYHEISPLMKDDEKKFLREAELRIFEILDSVRTRIALSKLTPEQSELIQRYDESLKKFVKLYHDEYTESAKEYYSSPSGDDNDEEALAAALRRSVDSHPETRALDDAAKRALVQSLTGELRERLMHQRSSRIPALLASMVDEMFSDMWPGVEPLLVGFGEAKDVIEKLYMNYPASRPLGAERAREAKELEVWLTEQTPIYEKYRALKRAASRIIFLVAEGLRDHEAFQRRMKLEALMSYAGESWVNRLSRPSLFE